MPNKKPLNEFDLADLAEFLKVRDPNEVIAAIINTQSDIDWSYILLNCDRCQAAEIVAEIDFQDLDTGGFELIEKRGKVHVFEVHSKVIGQIKRVGGADMFLFERINKDLLPEVHIECSDIKGYTGREPHIWSKVEDLLITHCEKFYRDRHSIDFGRDSIVLLPQDHL